MPRSHLFAVVAALVVGSSATARAALPDCSEASIRAAAPDDAGTMLDRAFDWVHRGVDYCQCVTGEGGPYRTDCSGFVSMVWELPAPGHTTYSFAGGPWDADVSHVISYDELLTGDAMNFPGDPNAGTGHVVLFAGWRNDDHTRYCSIEESHSGTPARVLERFVDPAFLPIRLNSRQGCVDAHCEGSQLVTSCGRGDCAVFGSRCVDDALGARCAFSFCPDVGEADVCLLDGQLAHCSDGSLASVGDCRIFGASCVADDLSARCVFGACPARGTAKVCFASTHIGDCEDGALVSQGDCAAFGQHCLVDGDTARCGNELCPATGAADVCADDTHIVHCEGGAAGAPGDCALFAAHCGVVDGVAHCISNFCTDPSTTPVAHETCFFERGARLSCDDLGAPTVIDCPAGQGCSNEGGEGHCAPKVCPDTGEADVCLGLSGIGHCFGGSVLTTKDCAVEGGFCTAAGGTPHCADAICADDDGVPTSAHDVCLPDGTLGHCDDDGLLASSTACAATTTCRVVDDAPACVADGDDGDGGGVARIVVHGGDAVVATSGCGCSDGSPGSVVVVALAALGHRIGRRRRRAL
jgi:hypothetical protein